MKYKVLIISILATAVSSIASGQETAFNRVFCTEHEDSVKVGRVSIDVDALAFFRDNEYDSDFTTGYTLPGTWIRPTAQYNPLENIHLELGISALLYSGANKYPCYAYQDIAMWKGDQYQSGVHLLPWIRADIKANHFNFVLGNIYGGAEHDFTTPLYNKEQTLSADPEMGVQILFRDRHFKGDAYINWQSFQFRNDNHQEVFTIGLSAKATPFHSPSLRDFSLRAAALVQHRGGEMDVPSRGVQTICDGSLGVMWEKQFKAGFINTLSVNTDVLGCYQQAGHLWHFDSGIAYNTSATATYLKGFHTQLGFFAAPSNFVSLYGNPYFNTISSKHEGLYFSGVKTAYLDFGYARTFAKKYTIGTNLELFSVHPGGANSEFNVSFGVYMRLNPTFL